MYKLIWADGTELTGFTKNGDNYIRKEKVDESVFKDNLSTLEITDGEETITMHNAELIQQVEDADGFHICFRELSAQELQYAALTGQIEDMTKAMNVLLTGKEEG